MSTYGYCNLTTDLKQWGPYLSKNVPDTLNMDLSFYVDKIYHQINEVLYKAGILVPVSSVFSHACARLKYLNALGAIGEMIKGVVSTNIPAGGKGNEVGKLFKDEFDLLLKGYSEFPRSLFAEESSAGVNIEAAFLSSEVVAPSGRVVWSYVQDVGLEPEYTVDKEF